MTWRRAVRGALAALLCAATLAGCTEDKKPAAQTDPPPELTPDWSIRGLNAMPQQTGARHWMTYQSTMSGVGRGTTLHQGPVLLVDVRTGKARQRTPESVRWPCLTPTRISDSGVTPVLWATRTIMPGYGYTQSEPCTRITVLDATTGKTLWRQSALDLAGLSRRRALAADDRAVAIVDHRGRRACFGARDGRTLPDHDESCLTLRDQLTHADLRLRDPDGNRVRLPFASQFPAEDNQEIGRTDEVVLVRVRDWDTKGGDLLVRAHDLRTGETLWQDELDPDPRAGGPWYRGENYFSAPSGVVRVSYEHPENSDDVSSTPMVLTAVDPRSGKDLRPVARVEGAWFNHQFGDVTVALTDEHLGLQSTISGFRLPTW